MTKGPAFNFNIWLHLFEDKYEELFAYSMKLAGNNKGVAEEIVRSLSIAYFANEEKLKEELKKLPSTYPEVLELHFFQSMSPKEITQKLPLTIHQVKRRLQVGLFYLRQNMNPYYFKHWVKKADEYNNNLNR